MKNSLIIKIKFVYTYEYKIESKVCDKIFTRHSSLLHHVNVVYNNIRFQHEIRIHITNFPLVCDICQKGFLTPNFLKNFLKTFFCMFVWSIIL